MKRVSKIVLFGDRNVGKTSMRYLIFENGQQQNLSNLSKSIGVTISKIRFSKHNMISLWDCGRDSDEKDIFLNVSIFIFVFDCTQKLETELYNKCVEVLNKNSPNAKIFCFFHKTDLNFKQKEIYSSMISEQCFFTTIYNESLYMAWSYIMQPIFMTKSLFNKQHLGEFLNQGVDFIIFDKTTFLVIYETWDNNNSQKSAAISKTFKKKTTLRRLLCLNIKTPTCVSILREFTEDTYILAITETATTMEPLALELNLNLLKKRILKI